MSATRSPYPVEELTVVLHRSRLGALWRWRTELLITLALLVTWARLSWWVGSYTWSLAILGGFALVLGVVPWSRHVLAACFWALFTRHRLQRAFWECRLHTRAGRLPLIVVIVATAVGSRALVLIRAGMTFADFEGNAAAFASACGALDCRVSCSARRSWLVVIDVIRRDVLGPDRVIASPLAELGPAPASSWPEPGLDPAQAED